MIVVTLGPRPTPGERWSRPRVDRTAARPLTCSRCRAAIDVGATFHQDRTGATHHPECRRIGTYTADLGPAAGRRRRSAPTCPACWQQLAPGEDSTPADGQQWHADCLEGAR